MTYTIEKHSKLPALIATWAESFVFTRDAPAYQKDMHSHLDQQKSPVYYVLDVRAWHDMTFDELLQGASIATRGEDPNFHHRMNLGTLFVTSDPTVRASAEGLRSDIFGNANVLVFNELDDALNYIIDQSR